MSRGSRQRVKRTFWPDKKVSLTSSSNIRHGEEENCFSVTTSYFFRFTFTCRPLGYPPSETCSRPKRGKWTRRINMQTTRTRSVSRSPAQRDIAPDGSSVAGLKLTYARMQQLCKIVSPATDTPRDDKAHGICLSYQPQAEEAGDDGACPVWGGRLNRLALAGLNDQFIWPQVDQCVPAIWAVSRPALAN